MTEEQINEIVQIDDAIRDCYLNAIERTDADREYREGQRNLAKWLEQLKRYKENEHRQKAEIERLKEDYSFSIKLNGLLQEQRDGRDETIIELDNKIDELQKSLQTAKSEAIKEFAERLKKEALIESGFEVLQSGAIDNLVKEMVGDSE